MNQKYLFAVVAIIIVLAAGFFIFSSKNDGDDIASNSNTSNMVSETDEVTSDTEQPMNTNTPPATGTSPSTGEPTAPQDPDIAVFEVSYNGTAFVPAQLTIKNGDIVIFKNESGKSFWPASGPHPEHTNYPEFDPKKAIPTGQDWQFKFTKSGQWGYHDHLNSSVVGRIIVQ